MRKHYLIKLNKFVCVLTILSLFLQFVPARQPAQAKTIIERAGEWLTKLTTKIALPNITLTEKGTLNVGSFQLLDKLGTGANQDVNPFSQFRLSIDGQEVKSQIALIEPALVPGCLDKYINESCDDKNVADRVVCAAQIMKLLSDMPSEIPQECINSKKGELTIPKTSLPEICELSIPLPGDNNCSGAGEKCETKILAKNKACVYLNRLQDSAAQEVYSAFKIFNATDPFTDCSFVRNCRTNCSLRIGEVAFSVSLLDVAALFIPGGWLTVVQKILNIAKMINQAFKIYTAIKDALSSGVTFLSDLFNVMGQLSSMYASFTNLGLKWSDVLIYGGGSLASKYAGERLQEIGVGNGGNIGWLEEKAGGALTAGNGLLGGVAASAILNADRVNQAKNGMQDMLGNFAQNNLKFSTAKSAAIAANEKLKSSVDAIRTSFKAEPEFLFFFQTETENANKKELNGILGDFQLFFRSVDDFLGDIKGAVSLKDGRPISDLALGGGLDEWQSRPSANQLWGARFVCSRDALQLPLGGGLPPSESGGFNCYVPDMVRPKEGSNQCHWFNSAQNLSDMLAQKDLKNFFELIDPDNIKRAIVGCYDLTCFGPGGCPNGPTSQNCQMECYGKKGNCKLTSEQASWRKWWEKLASALYGQEKWDQIFNKMKSDGLNQEDRFLKTQAYVNSALGLGPKNNPLSLMANDIINSLDRGWIWTRGLINTRVPAFFNLVRQKSITNVFFLENQLQAVKDNVNSLTTCVGVLDEDNKDSSGNDKLDNKFWEDLWWPTPVLPSDDAIKAEINTAYEGDAAYEDWDEKIKVIEANKSNFDMIEQALELGVSPEQPIVVYKIAQANDILEKVKATAKTLNDDDNVKWQAVVDKIIDSIIYGNPKEGFNGVCSVESCPINNSGNVANCLRDNQGNCRDCYAKNNNMVLRDYCEDGIFQTKIFGDNETSCKNYLNCCADKGNSDGANSCCDIGTKCDVGLETYKEMYLGGTDRQDRGYKDLCNDCLDQSCENCSSNPPGNPVCGNRNVETGEQCDDGNTISHDGCSSDCQYENYKCSEGVCIDMGNGKGVYADSSCENKCVVAPPDSGNYKCRNISNQLGAGANYWCKCVEYPTKESDASCANRMLNDVPQKKDCYSTEQNCIDNVGSPDITPPKYKCSGSPDYICSENSSGAFTSLADCRNSCKKPNPNPNSTLCRYLFDINPLTPWCNCQENPRDTDSQCAFLRGCYPLKSTCKDNELVGNPPAPPDSNIKRYRCSGANCLRDDENGIYTTSNCDNRCNASTPTYSCRLVDINGPKPYCMCQTGPTYESDMSCINRGDCYLDSRCSVSGKSASPFAQNIFDNLQKRLKGLAKSLIAIPKVFAQTVKQYCYPGCGGGTCFNTQAGCDNDFDNFCNTSNYYCVLKQGIYDKYKCFEKYEPIYRDGCVDYNAGVEEIKNLEDQRGSLKDAIIAIAAELQDTMKSLSDSFGKLQNDWNAPIEPFSAEHQESATAKAQIVKILNLKTNSEDIVNDKIPEAKEAINRVLDNITSLNELVVKVGDPNLKKIVDGFTQATNLLNDDVINFAYAKVGPEGLGNLYQCNRNKCATDSGKNTFLCKLKCFETTIGRTFDQLTTYTDILYDVENAAFGLTQAGENIKAIEPSMDMNPVTIKPNLVDEVDQRGQCCREGCPTNSGNSCAYVHYSVINKNGDTQKDSPNPSCSAWTKAKCSEKTSLYVGQRQGESNYEFFKANLLANPLSTLEDRFKAVSASVDLLMDEKAGMVNAFGDSTQKIDGLIKTRSNDISKEAKASTKGADGKKSYKDLSEAVLTQARYLWWDLIWGNEDVSQELLPACNITEQILTNDPASIQSQCQGRDKNPDNISLLPPKAGGANTEDGYSALKNQCKILTGMDLDVLENLKANSSYITDRIGKLDELRGKVGPNNIACPKWFCVSPDSFTWGAGMNKVDPFCIEVTNLYCQKTPDSSKGIILCDADNNNAISSLREGERDITSNIVWDPIINPTDGSKQWPPVGVNNWQGAQDMCISTQQEIANLNSFKDLLKSIGAIDASGNVLYEKIDALSTQCNNLNYQVDFARDCYNFSVLQKSFGSKKAINENWKEWNLNEFTTKPPVWKDGKLQPGTGEITTQDQDIENTKKIVSGFCHSSDKTNGKIITETINSDISDISGFFNCSWPSGNVKVDLTAEIEEAQQAREVALKLCSQSTTDMRTPLNEIMKVFSVLLGVKSYTSASNGLSALYFDAQKIRQRAEDVVNLIKEAPKKFAELWNSTDEVQKITKDNVKIKPVKCISSPMISYAGNGQPQTGTNGGQVCPNVKEQFNQLDASFSLVRQNLRMVDMARRQPTKAIGFGKLSVEIPGGDLYPIDPDLNDIVGPIYNRANDIKNKTQLLWALATAINFANENCACGQSYCPMLGSIPLCISGLPLTLTPLKQPFCHLVWTLRYPLGSLAEKLKQELEQQ